MQSSRHKKLKAALKRGFRRNQSARYRPELSPLWQLTSIHILARLLRVTVAELKDIAAAPLYGKFIDQAGTSKERAVQEPRGKTMRLHYRLVRLLDSIERPAFLHSATRHRSNVTNAEAHRSAGARHAIVKTDIRKFYESTSYAHVKAFFHKELGWPHDVARIMARVSTVDGHLPTGSCLSPLLSYYAHRTRFLEIEQLCQRDGVTMTLYVDDMTLSGSKATKRLLHTVKTLMRRSDLACHKDKFVAPGSTGLVTGVAIDGTDIRLRNKQHQAIVTAIDAVAAGDLSQLDSLNGKLAAARAVEKKAAAKLSERLAQMTAKASTSVQSPEGP